MTSMWRRWLICIALFVKFGGAATACMTHNAKSGECVQLDRCPKLNELAHSLFISVADKRLLKASICGTNMVCCENAVEADETEDVIITTRDESTEAPSPPEEKTVVAKMKLPDERVCGLDNVGERLVGGHETGLEQFRWTVALEYNINGSRDVKCGGALINTRYVITAAHCLRTVEAEDLIVRLGEYNLNDDPDCDEDLNCNEPVVFSIVDKIIIHPRYAARQADIALLKLRYALHEDYTGYILPICLPSPNLFPNETHQNVSVVGWGATENMTLSTVKRYANLQTIALDRCRDDLRAMLRNTRLTDSHICAVSPTDVISDACGGDSGGPLMIQRGGNWYLIGIVSFGPQCGLIRLPGLYTRVTWYMDWILDNLLE